TITQEQSGSNKVDLRGSVTYLDSPLRLNWADLYDEQRGIVLFDPETLEHELLTNPHAVGYTTADLQQVLGGQVDEGAVTDKHVMLIGKLTHLKYVTARDKLLSLGVRSVRDWTPMGFASHADRSLFGGLVASVPASDAAVQPLEEPTKDKTGLATTTNSVSRSDPGVEHRAERLDLAAEARGYVESLDLDNSFLLRRDELVRVDQRMIQVSREIADQDGEVKVNHQDFMDGSSQAVGTRAATEHPDACTTQTAINELLGTDYETYVRTVMLSHESAANFLNSTPAQRRDLIEASLGLSILDQCGHVSRPLLKNIDAGMNKVEGKLEGLIRTMEYNERRLEDLSRTQKRLKDEAEEAVASLEVAIQDHALEKIFCVAFVFLSNKIQDYTWDLQWVTIYVRAS
ncbi:hypothetical protein IL306_010928, partial [Fusarium sp. DS 682]